MAKEISDEELQLKKRARRRLVGAIALVLLAIVFLPMILDSEPRPLNQDIAITIPPIPSPEPALPQAAPPVPAVAAVPPDPEPAPAVSDPAPATESDPASASKAEALPPHPQPAPVAAQQAKAEEDFVVQLGAFSNSANAKALQKKLQENKFKAYTEVVKSAGSDRTRVRVGPYASREAAEKARDRMKALKLVIGEATVVRQGD